MGSPGVVDFNFTSKYFIKLSVSNSFVHFCLRPYHGETTGSRLISEVKHRRAWVVLRWGTTWEVQVSAHLDLPILPLSPMAHTILPPSPPRDLPVLPSPPSPAISSWDPLMDHPILPPPLISQHSPPLPPGLGGAQYGQVRGGGVPNSLQTETRKKQ